MDSHSGPLRLNKHLALVLGVSRREADDLIASGATAINGTPAVLGARMNAADTITVHGEPLAATPQHICIAFNKPAGYVCSRRAQGSAPTVYDLLPAQYRSLKTVGRLDKDSSGLILLTNDGDFAQRMTHPSFYKVKAYNLQLSAPLAPLHHQMINDFGVELADGPSRLTLMPLNDTDKTQWQVTMHEGRNRQIRRTFAALGYTVTALHRIQFGGYSLGDIKSGEHKLVDIQ